jgi:hypothetical protein
VTGRTRLLFLLLAAPLLLGACGADPGDADDLTLALHEVGGLTTEEASCVTDEITENSDYTEFFADSDEPPTLDDVLADVADGESDTEGLYAAFEQDVAAAVTVCTSLG